MVRTPHRIRSSSRVVVVLTATLALVLTTLLSLPAGAQSEAPFRFDADDPIDAAVQVSQLRFEADGSATAAVLATTRDFADALAGAALPIYGPLLLTAPDALSPATAAELTRVLPAGSEVLILGGAAAISDAVLADLQARGYPTRRLQGPTRVETAIAVYEEFFNLGDPAPELLLARSDAPPDNPTAGWADAISGSSLGPPILLTPQASLHPAVRTVLEGQEASLEPEISLLGGEAALSAAVADAIPEPWQVTRFQGPTRDATALAIAVGTGRTADAVLYDGFRQDGWAFGLSAATYARDTGAALLPVNGGAVATATRDFFCLDRELPVGVVVAGSEAIVSAATVQAHTDCDGGSTPPPTPPPSGEQVVLSGTGLLPDAQLGGDGQQAVEALTAALGAPTEDTTGPCPVGEGTSRSVSWGGLSVFLSSDGPDGQLVYFDITEADPPLTTSGGVGIGATNAEIRAAHPDAEFHAHLSEWTLPDGLSITVDGDADDDVAIQILAGSLGCS